MMGSIVPSSLAQIDEHGSLDAILRAARTHLGMEIGFISEFVDGRRIFRNVESADGRGCIEVGGSDPLEESYCHWIVQGKLPQLIRDPADHPLTERFAATKALPVGAHLSVPIRLRNGEIYGTFCCFSFDPDQSLTERDLATMKAFAEIASQQIQQIIDSAKVREASAARVRSALERRDVEIVYQPAVRLDVTRVEFVEALARFRSEPYKSPDRWFASAAQVGLGTDLELMAMGAATSQLSKLPLRTKMSINVSPETVLSDGFHSLLSSLPLERVIVEITEHESVRRYSELNCVLDPLRKRGLKVAIDDVGAGYSSLRHILQVRPDLIKLDMSLSQRVDVDPARKALATALVSFSRDIGSQLVAEGVETDGELATLRELGVEMVQGFLVGRPARLAELRPLLLGTMGETARKAIIELKPDRTPSKGHR